MFYTIYKITNQINGKIYIGKHQTLNLNDGYMGSGKYLKRAIIKYGIENFVKEILFVYDSEDKMNLAEKILVVTDREISYNLCNGGQGGFSFINKNNLRPPIVHNDETKKKISKSVKIYFEQNPDKKLAKKNFGEMMRQKFGEDGFRFFAGKKHSIESRRTMSEAQKRIAHPTGVKRGPYKKSDKTSNKLNLTDSEVADILCHKFNGDKVMMARAYGVSDSAIRKRINRIESLG